MAPKSDKRRASPFVFLSLCLSLLAVALSGMSLMMVYDLSRPGRVSKDALGVKTVNWDWSQRFDRARNLLAQVGEEIKLDDEAASATVHKTLHSLSVEFNAWARAAEPRFRFAVDELVAHTEGLRDALTSGTEVVAAKMKNLREGIDGLQKKMGAKE